MLIKKSLVGTTVLVVALFTVPFTFAAEPKFVVVGTGDVTGIYYPAGNAICNLINKNSREHGVRCMVQSTLGSIENLRSIDSELDLAIAQSDAQSDAYRGANAFQKNGPNKDLRSVLALHSEAFTVIARADSGIQTFDDLLGKRVNIGNQGSGQRETMRALMRVKGWSEEHFSLALALDSNEQAKALCDNQIDAFVFSVGHPAASLKEVSNSCAINIVSVEGAAVDTLIAENSAYRKSVVSGGTYRGAPNDVNTFSLDASLMASKSTSPDIIYTIVKSVFENLDRLKMMHPALSQLSRGAIAKGSVEIPIHAGAKRYYKERGFL